MVGADASAQQRQQRAHLRQLLVVLGQGAHRRREHVLDGISLLVAQQLRRAHASASGARPQFTLREQPRKQVALNAREAEDDRR